MEDQSNYDGRLNLKDTDNWFIYKDSGTTGVKWAIQMQQVLHREKTCYQEILIFKSAQYGNVLTLDGGIQCTEKDEFTYSEMMAHVPLNCHSNPKQVLIVGGGDGGVLREVLKHEQVEMVTQVEIDQRVVEACKKYFPQMTQGYDNKRCNLIIGDGIDYVKKNKNKFDVIINDCTDRGTDDNSMVLYTPEFWTDVKMALKPGGIATQIEDTIYYTPDDVQDGMTTCRGIFPSVAYGSFFVPSFCTDQGIRICSTTPNYDFQNPVRKWALEKRQKIGIRHYNEAIHRAAFAVPDYGRDIVNKDLVSIGHL